MSDEQPHDLVTLMAQVSQRIQSEYVRVRARATEDPGTAGDQGEENWADVLRGWLPANYHVVTKGRIIGVDGQRTPQIDVLVLKPSYPMSMLSTKLYLAAGVACAFECKMTLKAQHITEAVKTSVTVKSLFQPRFGTPYTELHSPIVYGLLAHSHIWQGANSDPRRTITEALFMADALNVRHPRHSMDLLCVSDLALWSSLTQVQPPPYSNPDLWTSLEMQYGLQGSTKTGYMQHHPIPNDTLDGYNPIGLLVTHTLGRMAKEDESCKDLARYFTGVLTTGGVGETRVWSNEIFSDQLRLKVAGRAIGADVERFLEWNGLFM